MTSGISTDKLTKRYPHAQTPALDSLTIAVKPGEIYGFLGANGAGKSTTIRLLMNFLRPTSGSASIAGFDAVSDSVMVKRHVGYLAGEIALYPKMTGNELLNYLAHLQGTVDRTYRKTLERRFEVEAEKPIGSLSKGNRQKIGILQALMHRPDVLILDEPTSGLDPLMQEAFYTTLHEARERGAAILMSSHNLDEVQRICDRIGVLKHGRLIREQAVDKLETGGQIFVVTLATQRAAQRLVNDPGVQILDQPATVIVRLRPAGSIADALKSLSKYEVVSLRTEQLDLEDEFQSFYGSES